MSTKRKAIKFKRMTDALLDSAGVGGDDGSSSCSGSEHFPSGSLSDMVNSFLDRPVEDGSPHLQNDGGDRDQDEGDDSDCSSSSTIKNEERKELLKKLLGHDDETESVVVEARRKIIQEIEAFNAQVEIVSVDSGFKRQLIAHLRQSGYDAGLCKSRWDKTERYPAGSYEYIDIVTRSDEIFSARRDIVEVMPGRLFEIAGPTQSFMELLEAFPCVYVGKAEKLKQVARVMSAAMKVSLKSNALPVAPWRRNAYLQAQWFAPNKRTTNAVSTRPTPQPVLVSQPQGKLTKVVVGFAQQINSSQHHRVGGLLYNCCREFSPKGGNRNELLAAAFQTKLVKVTSSQ